MEMNKQHIVNTIKNNGILTISVIFLLTNYIYKDFDIRFAYGYIVMLVVGAILIIAGRTIRPFTSSKIWFVILAVICSGYSILPSANKGETTSAITMSMLAFAVLVICSKTGMKESKVILNVLDIAALVIAGYVILIAIRPSFYWVNIYPNLSKTVQLQAYTLLRIGYGVPIGGSTTYADYVIAFALFRNVARLIFGKNRDKLTVGIAVKLGVYLIAILFENRRSELLMILVCLVVMYFMSLDRRHRADFLNKVSALVLIAAIGIFGFILLINSGRAARLQQTVAALVSNSFDDQLTGGRFTLWEKAFSLFKAHPLTGIGWERFITHNQYEHDVHNTYLQWLCETGVVGFVLIFIPYMNLLLIAFKNCQKILKEEKASLDVTVLAIVGFAMQLFYALINIIDPAFYHLNFFCFLGIAVIMTDSSQHIYESEAGAQLQQPAKPEKQGALTEAWAK